MIVFDPLWKTMKKKHISQYKLIKEYGFSTGQLSRLRSNSYVSTHTIAVLCSILDCSISDIMEYRTDNDMTMAVSELQPPIIFILNLMKMRTLVSVHKKRGSRTNPSRTTASPFLSCRSRKLRKRSRLRLLRPDSHPALWYSLTCCHLLPDRTTCHYSVPSNSLP